MLVLFVNSDQRRVQLLLVMVEGPLLHRLAFAHRKLLFGHRFTATSPTGRFADGAEAIDGHFLTHIEVHGKNIFYFFTPERVEEEGVLEKVGDDAVVVHIHLGMSGSFRLYPFPGPIPREATRLRLYNEELGFEAHLSASVCDHGNIELYRKKITELGPDPLRKDADKELLWASIQKTKRSIGAVLMDQTLVAGIGNIYRAEILFVVGLHPEQPANTVCRPTFEFLWEQSKRQMEIGVEVGNIITILPEDSDKPFPKKIKASQLRYVYNQKACGKCGGPIKVWTIAQRSVYACEACQPPPPSTTTVSKTFTRKTSVGIANSNLDESGDDVHSVSGIPGKRPTRKRVAEGGRVMVHQAYKNQDPKGLPESFVVPAEEQSHEHSDNDARSKEEVAQTNSSMQTDGDDKTGILNSSKPRKGRRNARTNQADQLRSLQSDVMNTSTFSKKPPERRSARLRKQAVTALDQPGSIALGFRGKSEFLPAGVARLFIQNHPTTTVRYARVSLSVCRCLDGSSSMRLSSANSPVRRLVRPLGSAPPIVKSTAFGSILLGAMFLRGGLASVKC